MTVEVKDTAFEYKQSVTERTYPRDEGNEFSVYNNSQRCYGLWEGCLLIENRKFSVSINGVSYQKLKSSLIYQGDLMEDAYNCLKSLGFEISISKDKAISLREIIVACDRDENEKFKGFMLSTIRGVINAYE